MIVAPQIDALSRSVATIDDSTTHAPEIAEAEEDLLSDLSAKSHEFIKDRLVKLPWDDMELLDVLG